MLVMLVLAVLVVMVVMLVLMMVLLVVLIIGCGDIDGVDVGGGGGDDGLVLVTVVWVVMMMVGMIFVPNACVATKGSSERIKKNSPRSESLLIAAALNRYPSIVPHALRNRSLG